ncbi:MAG: hypothetical protein BGO25_13950 [Acidobacteriales bacterium 59-55]|nr:hypothetical protein [Terriglobales bacterium]OJV44182.1 MAG: hypothetical protein BGO25_13950 [Acidobacteriales bacterium 59-55]
MTQASQNGIAATQRAFGSGYFFGIPVGDFGLFVSVLMSLTVAIASFFAATFLGIVGLLISRVATGRMPDFSIAYKWIGLPVGLAVLVLTLAYLSALWIKRKRRHA